MTITTKSEDEKIECFYDSIKDRETFTITIPSGKFGFITIRVNVARLDGLIKSLTELRQRIRIATGR